MLSTSGSRHSEVPGLIPLSSEVCAVVGPPAAHVVCLAEELYPSWPAIKGRWLFLDHLARSSLL